MQSININKIFFNNPDNANILLSIKNIETNGEYNFLLNKLNFCFSINLLNNAEQKFLGFAYVNKGVSFLEKISAKSVQKADDLDKARNIFKWLVSKQNDKVIFVPDKVKVFVKLVKQ